MPVGHAGLFAHPRQSGCCGHNGVGERAKKRDAREQWQKEREARFAEQIYDDLHVLDDAVALLADKSKAAATARKYKLHWARFVKFAAENVLDDGYGMRALPASPELAAFFFLDRVDARPVVFDDQADARRQFRMRTSPTICRTRRNRSCVARRFAWLGNMTASFRRPS